MKQREFHIGPGAASLMLVIVAVSMSMLGLLSLMNARGDYQLFKRSSSFVQAEYQTAAAAQRSVAELDALLVSCALGAEDEEGYLKAIGERLPEGMTMEGNVVSWTETEEGSRMLFCAVEIALPGSDERYVWREHVFIAGESDDEAF